MPYSIGGLIFFVCVALNITELRILAIALDARDEIQ